MPKVSVVLPTRDRAATLEAAVKSVVEGAYEDLELLVVDDASSDGTHELLARLDDDRIKVITMETPAGAAAARNAGLARATGDLIAFQDSDDVWTDDHLDVLVPAVEPAPSPLAVAYGVVQYSSGFVVPGGSGHALSGDLRDVLVRHNVIGLPASLIRADAVRRVGGFEPTLPRFQDWDLFLALSAEHRFAFVDRVVLAAGEGEHRISTDGPAYFAAMDRLLARHPGLFARQPAFAVAYRMQLANHALRARRPRQALRHARAAATHPTGLARWIWDRGVMKRSPVVRGGNEARVVGPVDG